MVKKAWRPADSESLACQFQLEVCQKTRHLNRANIDSDGGLAAFGRRLGRPIKREGRRLPSLQIWKRILGQ
jgi:hypothetical protein